MNKADFHATRIHYTYELAPEARLQVAHGVWGGVTPQGEIEIQFYSESDTPPPYSDLVIGPDGMPGPEVCPGDDDQRNITRHIHSRLLLNYNTARAVLDWLEERVNELEQEFPTDMFMPDSDIAKQ